MIRLNSLDIHCLHCDHYFNQDCSDFEADNDYDNRQMGTQIGYHWECELQCPDCDAEGTINVDAWEYPLGIIDYHEGRSSGELEVAEYDIDLLQESDDDESVDDSEEEQDYSQHSVTRPSIPATTYLLHNVHPSADISMPSVQGSVGKMIPDMGAFLNQSIQRIYDDFIQIISRSSPLENQKCSLYFTFVKGDPDEIKYSKKEHQQLYLLRYFYAYLIEYWYLYSKISLKSYNIFSIGCGCFADLYGFLYAMDSNTTYSYYGIDCEDWPYKDLLPNPYMHGIFEKKSLSTCIADFQKQGLNETLGNFNVFIFPKTIEYLENEWVNDVTALAKCIKQANLKNKTIYLILNGMEDLFEKDVERLDILKDAFISKGFYVEKELTKPNLLPNSFYELSKWKKFPDDIKHFLSKVCEKCYMASGCSASNKPNRAPILSVDHFQYKIIKLVKNDS